MAEPQWFLAEWEHPLGSFFWRIKAESAQQIRESLATIRVVTDPEYLAYRGEGDKRFDLNDLSGDKLLTSLREDRDAQRDKPGFGALVGKERVFLRFLPTNVTNECLREMNAEGHQVRQVELRPDGTRVRSTETDWKNPAIDLYDPEYAAMEITEAEFECEWVDAAWRDDELEGEPDRDSLYVWMWCRQP